MVTIPRRVYTFYTTYLWCLLGFKHILTTWCQTFKAKVCQLELDALLKGKPSERYRLALEDRENDMAALAQATFREIIQFVHIPSGYVKIAIEHDHLWWIYPLKMGMFRSYVSVPEGSRGYN